MKKYFLVVLLLMILFPINVSARGGHYHHSDMHGCGFHERHSGCPLENSYIYGCTDSKAQNYDIYANINDGSCEYLDEKISKENISSSKNIYENEDDIKNNSQVKFQKFLPYMSILGNMCSLYFYLK